MSAKQLPLLATAEVVRAILDGRQTQDRRPMKVQPTSPATIAPDSLWVRNCTTAIWPSDTVNDDGSRYDNFCACPYGKVGDLLYVRETGHVWHEDGNHAIYRADGENQRVRKRFESYGIARWTPSIHMPKWAARIWLEITDIRVERVQDISEEDAIAEGMTMYGPASLTNRGSFAKLWNKLYGTWDANPYVWAITFKRVEKPKVIT